MISEKEICTFGIKEFGNAIKSCFYVKENNRIIFLISDNVDEEEVKLACCKISKDFEVDCIPAYKYFTQLLSNDIEAYMLIANCIPLYDPDEFLFALKSLALSNKVIGTHYSSRELIDKAKKHLRKVNNLKLRALAKIYRAVVDAAEAALSARGYSIPPHEKLPSALTEKFVSKEILEKKYAKICQQIISDFTAFEHGSIRHINAEGLEKMLEDANDFVERMRTIVR